LNSDDPDFASITFEQSLSWLFQRNQFAMKLGLENIRALLRHCGSPDQGLRIIHVAGTNGKGSVCGNCAALLRASGLQRVGLYTSPHLISFRERIRVDGEPIPRSAVSGFLREYGAYCRDAGATYFEIATAMALWHFKAMRCEAVVLETGLGGRLDATNAVLPEVTVITPVAMDHMAQLGSTLPAIFAEKAAILKPGIPMVVAEQKAGLIDGLLAQAKAWNCPVFRAENYPGKWDQDQWIWPGIHSEIRLPADLRPEHHQGENLVLACLACEAFLRGPLPAGENLVPYLQKALPPGRTQVLNLPGHAPLVLDGAHNSHGLLALVETLRLRFPGKARLFLFAMMADKPVDEALGLLGAEGEIRLLPLWETYPRAWKPASNPFGEPLPMQREALLAALRTAGEHRVVIVCGSLYLLGEVMALLAQDFEELAPLREFLPDLRPRP